MAATRAGRHPERVGRYRLVRPLASGGMATVYLAQAGGLGGFERKVAVKLLHPHLSQDAGVESLFLSEARIAAGLHHPHVVPVTDVGSDDEGLFLVMDYVEGATLRELLDREPRLERSVALRIACDMLAGLHAAHEHCDEEGQPLAIVHRDVSPSNVLVGKDGVARITDFGIAKARSRVKHTAPGIVRGKLPYMSPEQAQSKALDRRADVWSAGCVVWELLAGRALYGDGDDALVLLRLLQEPVESLAAAAPDVGDALSAVVALALAKDLDARTESAQAFRDALVEAAGPGGLASHEQVGEIVRLVEADGPPAPAARLDTPLADPANLASPIAEEVSPSRTQLPTTTTPPRSTRRIAAAIAATAGVAGIIFLARGSSVPAPAPAADPPIAANPPVASPAASFVQTGASVESTSLAPPAATSARLTVRSALPLRTITVGGITETLDPPTDQTTLDLPPARPGETRLVVGTAIDGRRLVATAPAGTTAIVLALVTPATAKPPPKGNVGQPAPLPKSPYE